MYNVDMRELSFVDWPFREDCNCTPEKMAQAGFIHCPTDHEPDVARCFYCLIELEGWEPDDDPWSEHEKRSPNCGFLKMKKDFTELTVAEFFNLEKERLKVYLKKVCHQRIAYFREDTNRTLACLQSQLDSI
ncbi:baculoviral IAP repeat-containing protein 5b [Salarias fasciatus]|nr:baculoviral IAP repeat-containing protein 5.1-A-like [Salarias fasciatus]